MHTSHINNFGSSYDIGSMWSLSSCVQIGVAVNSARQRLIEAQISTAGTEVFELLSHVLQRKRSWFFANHDYELTQEEALLYTKVIVARSAHTPLTMILDDLRKNWRG